MRAQGGREGAQGLLEDGEGFLSERGGDRDAEEERGARERACVCVFVSVRGVMGSFSQGRPEILQG